MTVRRKRIGGGVGGRRLVKNMAAVLFVFSCNFHLVKYLCKTVMACVRRRTMVTGLQDWVNRAVSSAYRASWVWGEWGISEMYMAKSVVDSTAPSVTLNCIWNIRIWKSL